MALMYDSGDVDFLGAPTAPFLLLNPLPLELLVRRHFQLHRLLQVPAST
jgi:hypothetical protein